LREFYPNGATSTPRCLLRSFALRDASKVAFNIKKREPKLAPSSMECERNQSNVSLLMVRCRVAALIQKAMTT
jgi:hypothetical protein